MGRWRSWKSSGHRWLLASGGWSLPEGPQLLDGLGREGLGQQPRPLVVRWQGGWTGGLTSFLHLSPHAQCRLATREMHPPVLTGTLHPAVASPPASEPPWFPLLWQASVVAGHGVLVNCEPWRSWVRVLALLPITWVASAELRPFFPPLSLCCCSRHKSSAPASDRASSGSSSASPQL